MIKKALQKSIMQRIHAYDPCALVQTLFRLGLKWEDILFKGEYDFSSPAFPCKKIEFHLRSKVKVTITFNFGLLSPNTSIPSYFFRDIDASPTQGKNFLNYLGYFNHFILKDLIQSWLIEESPHIFRSWSGALEDYFCLTALNSLMSLDSLFRLVFPDLGVHAKKMPQREVVKNSIFRLGGGSIGPNAVIGGNATKTYESFSISLYANEDLMSHNQPWAKEVKRRLENTVFPILRNTSIHLMIELVIITSKNQLTLSETSYLGFERIGDCPHPLRLLIYYGEVSPAATSQTLNSIQSAETHNDLADELHMSTPVKKLGY